MASKIKTVFVCSSCGYEAPKWVGKCPQCAEWNTMEEETVNTVKSVSAPIRANLAVAKTINEIVVEIDLVDNCAVGQCVVKVCVEGVDEVNGDICVCRIFGSYLTVSILELADTLGESFVGVYNS